jgi:hypothetical protein
MKRVSAGLLTAAILGVVAGVGLRHPVARENDRRDGKISIESAEERIRTLLQSARDGNIQAYLGAFDGPLRQRLEREIAERGRDAFAADLGQAARSRKSHAIFAAESEPEDVARVAVETVYSDRIERQTFCLCRKREGWLVTELSTVRGHEPKSKFGSPASFHEPEGVPVQPASATDEAGQPPE